MAAAQGGEDVYASLLLTDTYLPGALVLAHSLRDAGTKKKLAILVTLDSVSAEVVSQLKAVYDYVIPVSRIRNERPANLYLMNRPDLHSAFTKINLWKQTQFRKIVYLDADVLAYRAPDELFDLPHAFSAAPDIGWPDLFNTGVMALTPNMGDYYAMMAMAERGISFDGADQGLLNMHFKNTYNRLSFTYNVTPSAHYQYVPAYKHFQSSINLVHFIGSEKPWLQGRDKSTGDSPFDEIAGRWWAVYDRHYRAEALVQPELKAGPVVPVAYAAPAPELVRYFVKGEYQPTVRYVVPVGEAHPVEFGASHVQATGYHQEASQPPPPQPESKPEHYQPPPMHSWDAQWQPPPSDSKPEALNFPQMHYEMSSDPTPFVPPERYPSPPRDMWYAVPKEPPAPAHKTPKAIFPWESHRPQPARVFPYQDKPESPIAETPAASFGSPTVEPRSEPQTPPTPTGRVLPSDPWSSFPRTNAWDEVPEINRYVDAIQKHRRTRSQGQGKTIPELRLKESSWGRKGSRVTDFPSEDDRPSLPVTPAPIRRPRFWGGGAPGLGLDDEEDDERLPAAEGVPAQPDWVCVHGYRWSPSDCLCDLTNVLRYHKDPLAQLQKLAKQQSEMLLRLSGSSALGDEVIGTEGREIPSRPLPFGSENAKSPTYVAYSPAEVVSPKPVKPDSGASPVQSILDTGFEEAPKLRDAAPSSGIELPSYQGPGVAFEKGESILAPETPMPPTEEERDVLET